MTFLSVERDTPDIQLAAASMSRVTLLVCDKSFTFLRVFGLKPFFFWVFNGFLRVFEGCQFPFIFGFRLETINQCVFGCCFRSVLSLVDNLCLEKLRITD